METLQLPGFGELSIELAQKLYDPANLLVNDPRLTQLELEERQQRFVAYTEDMYGIDSTTHDGLLQALACDAVESALEDEEVLIARIGREVDAERLVVPAIRELVTRSEQQATEILEKVGIEQVPPEKQTLYACARIAQAAYDGKWRKTGERYYEHPKRAAAMALHILTLLENETYADSTNKYVIDQDFKNAVICAALLHDATEETIRSCKYYDPDRPKGFSPLLVREIFRQTGNPYGGIVANSLRLMTHRKELEWAPDYETYVILGTYDFIFDLVKSVDIKDNSLHPKPITDNMSEKAVEKIKDRRNAYVRLLGKIALNANEHTDNRHNKIWAQQYFKKLKEIRSSNELTAMTRTLDIYIYGSEIEPHYGNVTELRPGSSSTSTTILEGVAA